VAGVKLNRILVCVMIVVASPACRKKTHTPPVTAASTTADPATKAYRASLAELIPIETAALDAVAAHTGANYTDDAALLSALRDVAIPKYKEFEAGLAKITPGTPQLTAVHGRLTALAAREREALEQLSAAIGRGDGQAVMLVNEQQRTLRHELDDLVAELEKLP
jgi:hypothetical protein